MPLIMFVSSSFNTYVNLPKKKDAGLLKFRVDMQISEGIDVVYGQNNK